MPPAHRLLVLLCLAGSFFTGWHLAQNRNPRELADEDEQSAGQIRILQQQIQMLQEQMTALENENRNLRTQLPGQAVVEPGDGPDIDAETDTDISDVLRQALAYLARPEDPCPPVTRVNPAAMRTAIRGALVGNRPDIWKSREAVWKGMGLIPAETDLLLSFEDMILENFPLLPQDQSASLLLLDGTTPHLGQVVPPLAVMFNETENPHLWGDAAEGRDDATWLRNLSLLLGHGLHAWTKAVVTGSAGADPAASDVQESAFFRAPVAVRELFLLLPQMGATALQKIPGGNVEGTAPHDRTARAAAAESVLDTRPVWVGTWGKTLTGLLLKQFLPEDSSVAAVQGWTGDRLIGFPHSSGSLQLLWTSQWTSAEEAGKFHTALSRYLSNRWGTSHRPDAADPATGSGGPRTFSTDDGREIDIRFSSDRTGVIMALASDPEWLKALVELGADTRP